jgi:hypothetical protein
MGGAKEATGSKGTSKTVISKEAQNHCRCTEAHG